MALCERHQGRASDGCPPCVAEELAMLKATLGAHLHEYRLALGETLKEKETLEKRLDALELLLTQTARLLDSVSKVSEGARSFILTDPAYPELAAWMRGRKAT